MSEDLALQIRGITKRFTGVLANDRVNFDLRRSEIHALLGENGAGKSTLMNIISGLYSPDTGEITVEGEVANIGNTWDAIRCGIHMVHQHFMLVPVFTVTENIMLGNEMTRGLSLDMQKARQQIHGLSQDYGLKVDPDAIVESLPVGLQQRVEILKALYRQAKILILDEPTAALTPQEVEDLFRVMRRLTQQGVSIIFITHKLKEVMTVADRITVIRRGRMIGTTPPDETDEKDLAEMMVGREVLMQIEKAPVRPSEVVLDIKNLTVLDDRKVEAVRDVSFQVRAGEIFGIAGVQGNGQTELAAALTGLRGIQTGKVHLTAQEVPQLKPRVLIELGLAHIPEDRLKYGLVLSHTIADNQILCTYYKPPFAHHLQRNEHAVLENSNRLIQEFDIRTTSPLAAAGTLSGGNQQKLIVSREMSRDIRLLVANQPTRGLDVGSIEYIHHQIVKMRDQGVAVLLISVELDEIMSLSDQIGVMYDGQILAIHQANQVTREQLGLYMAGTIPADV
jgi:simple sugar transport system ATP-binding protein